MFGLEFSLTPPLPFTPASPWPWESSPKQQKPPRETSIIYIKHTSPHAFLRFAAILNVIFTLEIEFISDGHILLEESLRFFWWFEPNLYGRSPAHFSQSVDNCHWWAVFTLVFLVTFRVVHDVTALTVMIRKYRQRRFTYSIVSVYVTPCTIPLSLIIGEKGSFTELLKIRLIYSISYSILYIGW